MPQTIAILGAGPAGLVAAKTLLQQSTHPRVTVFEKCDSIGGVWSGRDGRDDTRTHAGPDTSNFNPDSENHKFTLQPPMETNTSRAFIQFSDLSWTSVPGLGDLGLYPRAWQVRLYLREYARRYIPPGVVRTGCEVVRVSEGEAGWGG